jgi:serine/threonine-protein kinase
LFYRPVDQFDAIPLSGTEGAANPFFSPDGFWVGFFADDTLKKISLLTGGTPETICDAPLGSAGASWGRDNVIIFAPVGGRGLRRVTASGGVPEVLTEPNTQAGELEHGWPHILPSGAGVVFTITRKDHDARLAVLSQESQQWTLLTPATGGARYLPTGHLVYAFDDELLSIEFDPEKSTGQGSPRTVDERVLTSATSFGRLGKAYFDLSTTGTLVSLPAPSVLENEPVWVDRSGKITEMAFPPDPGHYSTPRLSPHDGRLAIVRQADVLGRETWIQSKDREQWIQLTESGSDNRSPVWASDGHSLIFASNRLGPQNIFSKTLVTGEVTRLLASSDPKIPVSQSRDEHSLAFYTIHPDSGRDIGVLSSDGLVSEIVRTPFNERSPALSPDGRWIAYVSDATGVDQIYLQPYPATGDRWTVSPKRSHEPVWSLNGTELFFRRGDQMHVVKIAFTTELVVETPHQLFERRLDRDPGGNLPNYDVTADGQHFVMLRPTQTPHEIRLTLDWVPAP